MPFNLLRTLFTAKADAPPSPDAEWLAAIAESKGQPMTAVVEQALDALERREFLEAGNRRYAELRADPAAWAEVVRPRGVFERLLPRSTTSSITRGRFLKIAPSTRKPPLAKVAYARASSSGVTASVPRPIE